jgi:hypothetical protein
MDEVELESGSVVVVNEEDESAGFDSFAEPPADNAEVDAEEETAQEEPQGEQGEVEQGESQAEQLTPEQEAVETQKELKALLDKLPENQQATDQQIRKIHGKLGELNQQLLKLQGGSTAKLRINPEKLKRLSEEFDPDFARNLAEDLSEAIEGMGVGDNDFDEKLAQATETIKQSLSADFSVQLLDITHRNWRQDIKSPEFADWKGTLSAQELDVVDNSQNPVEAADMLTRFKEWRAEKNTNKQRNNQRLASAITPVSKGSVVKGAVTEEDGFNAVASGR